MTPLRAATGFLAVLALVACDAQGNISRIQQIGERRMADEDEVRFLVERLEKGEVEERVSAAWALGQAARADAVPQLIRTVREDADANVRINAIQSLARLGGHGVKDLLVESLNADDERIRSAALRALADARYADAAPRVGRLVQDEDPMVRAVAVDVLGSMGGDGVLPILQAAAGDDDADVRSRAAFAMGKIRDSTSVPTLTAMLEDDRWEVRANAVQALGMIGDAAARPAVEGMLRDPNEHVRTIAERASERLP